MDPVHPVGAWDRLSLRSGVNTRNRAGIKLESPYSAVSQGFSGILPPTSAC